MKKRNLTLIGWIVKSFKMMFSNKNFGEEAAKEHIENVKRRRFNQ